MRRIFGGFCVLAILGGFLLTIGACGSLELATISFGKFAMTVLLGFAVAIGGLLGITLVYEKIDE